MWISGKKMLSKSTATAKGVAAEHERANFVKINAYLFRTARKIAAPAKKKICEARAQNCNSVWRGRETGISVPAG